VTGLWRSRPWLVRLVAGCVLVLFLVDALSSAVGGMVFGGVLTVASVFFLVKRRYGALAVFLLVAVLVAWLASLVSEIALAAGAIAGHLA
jgi:hypothetical protein